MHFLRPTMRGWVVFFAGVIWILVAMVNRMVFPFLMGCAALALCAGSLVCALLSLRGVSVKRGAAGDAVAGETVSLPLVVANHLFRRRQPMVVIEQVPFAADPVVRTVIPPMASRGNEVVDRRVLAIRRGEYDLGRVIVRGGDPAGLFCRERRLELPSRILVYPGWEPVPDLALHQSDALGAVAGSPVSAAGMSQEFYGVREYHPMDGLRYIHWRSSARYGHLMVREFERNAVTSVGILIDANEHFVSGTEHWSNLETIIRAGASICQYCSGLYCTLGLAASGQEPSIVRPGLASDIRDEVMMTLTRHASGRLPFSQCVLPLVRELPRGSVVFCFSLSASRDIQETLDLAEQQGMDVRWYCAERGAFSKPHRSRGGGGRSKRHPAGSGRHAAGNASPAYLRPGMRLEEALVWTPARQYATS